MFHGAVQLQRDKVDQKMNQQISEIHVDSQILGGVSRFGDEKCVA